MVISKSSPTKSLSEELLDKHGHLLQFKNWSRGIALALAKTEGIEELTEAHWLVITEVQALYEQYALTPPNRILISHLQKTLGDEYTALYTNTLFKGNPSRLAAKISGLPKPAHCL